MKKLILPFLAILFIMACTRESGDGVVPSDGAIKIRSSNGQVAVCHNGHVIHVSVNALPAHLAHGDAIDSDGDGYFSGENNCGLPVDCNDGDPDFTEFCCPQGFWCDPSDLLNLNITFFENCDASFIFTDFCVSLAGYFALEYLGSIGNVHTYHLTDPEGRCFLPEGIVTVVDNGTSLTVSMEDQNFTLILTQCMGI